MIYLNKHAFIKLLTKTKLTYRIKMEDREKTRVQYVWFSQSR